MVRDYLAHLAVHQHVSASTQNQACCAILFLCREVLGVNVEGLSPSVRAKRGERLPVVLSMPETMALLSAMSGTPRLMATLTHVVKELRTPARSPLDILHNRMGP